MWQKLGCDLWGSALRSCKLRVGATSPALLGHSRSALEELVWWQGHLKRLWQGHSFKSGMWGSTLKDSQGSKWLYCRQDLISQFSTVAIKALKVLKNTAELLSPGHSLMVSSTVLAPFSSALRHLDAKWPQACWDLWSWTWGHQQLRTARAGKSLCSSGAQIQATLGLSPWNFSATCPSFCKTTQTLRWSLFPWTWWELGRWNPLTLSQVWISAFFSSLGELSSFSSQVVPKPTSVPCWL